MVLKLYIKLKVKSKNSQHKKRRNKLKVQHLYIIRGLPGSGKSTLAKLIAEAKGYIHHEADMYFTNEDGDYNFIPEKIKDAHKWCLESTKEVLEKGVGVVVSNTFTTQWQVQPYIDVAKDLDVEIVLIECKSNFGSIHGVPVESLERMKQIWEELSI